MSLPFTDTAVSVRDYVAQLIAEVRVGKTNAKVAATLVQLLNLQLRSIEVVNGEELKRRLDAVEERLRIGETPRSDDASLVVEVVKQ